MVKRILVPLDGSGFGDFAVPFAVSLARRSGATLDFVHVHLSRLPGEGLEYLTQYRWEDVAGSDDDHDAETASREREWLGYLVQATVDEGVPASSHLLRGPIAPTVEAHAHSSGADLIVMSTHGRSGPGRYWLGSVADSLVRRVSVPVLLLRPPETAGPPAREPEIRRILVPLDGSPFSESILGPALGLAALFGAKVSLLQVISTAPWPGGASDPGVAGWVEHSRSAAASYLDALAQKLPDDVAAPPRVLVHPHAAQAILHMAEQEGADLIAMATHGSGGVRHMLLGSTADKVIRGSHRPILVLRPQPIPPAGRVVQSEAVPAL